MLQYFGADIGKLAFGAVRSAARAHISAVQQQPVVSVGKAICRNVLHQNALHLERRVSRFGHESEPVAHSVDMRVYRHCRLTKRHRLHHVGRLAPHSGQLQQVVESPWHLAAKVLHYHSGEFHQVPCLGIGIRHAFHVFIHLSLIGRSHCLCVGIMPKQFGSDLIYTLVGALGAQHNSHKQLEHRPEFQFGGNLRTVFAEIVYNIIEALFSFHKAFAVK